MIRVTVRTGSGRGDGTPHNLGLKPTGNGLVYAPRNPLPLGMGSCQGLRKELLIAWDEMVIKMADFKKSEQRRKQITNRIKILREKGKD